MHLVTIVLVSAFLALVIAGAVLRSRSQKRTREALAGLENSQRDLGEFLGELSVEFEGAVNENAALVGQLEAALALQDNGFVVEARAGGSWYVNLDAIDAACRHLGAPQRSEIVPMHLVGAGVDVRGVASSHWLEDQVGPGPYLDLGGEVVSVLDYGQYDAEDEWEWDPAPGRELLSGGRGARVLFMSRDA